MKRLSLDCEVDFMEESLVTCHMLVPDMWSSEEYELLQLDWIELCGWKNFLWRLMFDLGNKLKRRRAFGGFPHSLVGRLMYSKPQRTRIDQTWNFCFKTFQDDGSSSNIVYERLCTSLEMINSWRLQLFFSHFLSIWRHTRL